MIQQAMREFLRIAVAVVAVLAAYFGYVYLHRLAFFEPRVRDARMLMSVLDNYYTAKGAYPALYPVLQKYDVPVAVVLEVLADSSVDFGSRVKFNDPDRAARYVSVDGKSYGLLYHFEKPGLPPTCIVEVGARNTGWWGQPPSCPW
ncbi:hypothetical protein [Bradyrhizobium manausense]|uniref:hypothetical protein n=1 Tax=Bradyrhizobium manausense TaxID=989370 RepID=UPI001BAB4F5B|nr:hypothetical protein [Bradyrhizobium manausense]MBR0723689.1 hypothetical protein [Bradyrhizobium manausense]